MIAEVAELTVHSQLVVIQNAIITRLNRQDESETMKTDLAIMMLVLVVNGHVMEFRVEKVDKTPKAQCPPKSALHFCRHFWHVTSRPTPIHPNLQHHHPTTIPNPSPNQPHRNNGLLSALPRCSTEHISYFHTPCHDRRPPRILHDPRPSRRMASHNSVDPTTATRAGTARCAAAADEGDESR